MSAVSSKIRNVQLESMQECMQNFAPYTTLPQKYQESLVRRLERGCHNANIKKAHKNHTPNYWDNEQFVEQYETICYNAKVNLDPKSSVNEACGEDGTYLASAIYHTMLLTYLVDRFAEGFKQTYLDLLGPAILFEIFENIVSIQPIDVGGLNSIDMNPSISKKYIEEIALRENQTIKKKYTTVYPCPSHGHRMANYREVQTRSGDEGSTLFLTCLQCGIRWRVYD
jgi:Transcription factor S-II (TFIIS)